MHRTLESVSDIQLTAEQMKLKSMNILSRDWETRASEGEINATDVEVGGHFRKRAMFARCSMTFIAVSAVLACSKQEWEVSFMNVCIAVVEHCQ